MNQILKNLSNFSDLIVREVFIVIDASDECPQTVDSRERDKLPSLVHSLFSNHGNTLHILTTSRREFDIHSGLKSYPAIDVEAPTNTPCDLHPPYLGI